MPIDPYAACPGGTGKKVKFCCPELVGELDKIEHMLARDQRQACLEHIRHLEAAHPNKACLMNYKAALLTDLGEVDEAQATVDKVLAMQPDNPVALSEAALLAAESSGGREGLDLLLKAIVAGGQQMHGQVYAAIGTISDLLLSEGHIMAARGLREMQLRIDGEDKEALQGLMRMTASPNLPVQIKDGVHLEPPPEHAPWQAELADALADAMSANWHSAAEKLTALAQRAPDAPAVWHNLAVVRGWLADPQGMVAALRHYATLAVPEEDAVEALALAEILDHDPNRDTIEEVRIVYPVLDIERANAHLASDARIVTLPVDVSQLGSPDHPPPRAAYWIVDRVPPESIEGLPLGEIPLVLGRAFLFGRETDREPRLEVEAYKSDRAKADAILKELSAGSLGPAGEEEVVDRVGLTSWLIQWRGHVPQKASDAELRRLFLEHRRDALLVRWPAAPQESLGGKTMAEVAADPARRLEASAHLLVLEQTLGDMAAGGLVDELRAKLGLPVPGVIDPEKVEVLRLPAVRLARVDVARLPDKTLKHLYDRVMLIAHRTALRKIGAEMVARPSLDGQVDKANIHGTLARLEDNPEQVLEHLQKARAAAHTAGQSCARWDMEEFMLRLQRGEGAEAEALLQHIQNRHGREPGVREALMNLLMQAGIVGPDGRVAVRPPEAESPGLVLPGGQAAESGKIWTPGGDAPQGKKSALWTPGMD